MIKKSGILFIIILTIAIWFLYKSSITDQEPEAALHEMAGNIVEVKNGSIMVEGTVGSENKTIEFVFDNRTVFKKMTIVITEEQFKSGESFQPETPITAGAVSELANGIRVLKITSKENLLTAGKASATEIYYLLYSYDFPLP